MRIFRMFFIASCIGYCLCSSSTCICATRACSSCTRFLKFLIHPHMTPCMVDDLDLVVWLTLLYLYVSHVIRLPLSTFMSPVTMHTALTTRHYRAKTMNIVSKKFCMLSISTVKNTSKDTYRCRSKYSKVVQLKCREMWWDQCW